MGRTSRTECARIEHDLILLLDGALDALRADAVKAHFGQCGACAGFYRTLREQLVLHPWAEEGSFELDSEGALDADVPDFAALSTRLRTADVQAMGTLLYEILKAEFLYDYGDNVAADQEPIADPAEGRARGSQLVEELRDWVDGDRVDGVDLRDVARRFARPGVDNDRLQQLIDGMAAVARLNAELRFKAAYYQGLAHVKARREAETRDALMPVATGAPPGLARYARIALATLPGLVGGRHAESIPLLEACLGGDASDALIHFNLAKAHFEVAGHALTEAVARHAQAARALDADMVERQLSLPSERRLRLALTD